jgi:transcriptional regulator with XRE-family HTH domain
MSMDGTNSFGYWLRRRRKALDMTQDELAQRAGCALDTIKKIETDARRPSRQLAERLADGLQVGPEERSAFLKAARAELAADRLALPTQPVDLVAERLELPAFLTQEAQRAGDERSVFVGRERELAALDRHLAAALGDQGRVVFVTGEAGDGKTALLSRFARRAQAAHDSLIVAAGTCNAYAGLGDPYLPFRDVLGMLSGDVESRWAVGALTQEQARRLWATCPQTIQALIERGPDLIDVFVPAAALARSASTRFTSETGGLARLKVLANRRGETGRREQRQLFEQYTEALRAVAARQPLIVLLDDLQWADAASIDLLFHLGRRLGDARILIVGAYRLSEVALGRTTPESSAQRLHPLKPVVNELARHFGDIQVDLGNTPLSEGRQFVDALLDSQPNALVPRGAVRPHAWPAALHRRTAARDARARRSGLRR